MQSLDTLKIEEKAIIKSINPNSHLKRRLQDIGLVKDTLVKCELISPSGNPVAYRIKGALIAIRKEDSKNIIIEII